MGVEQFISRLGVPVRLCIIIQTDAFVSHKFASCRLAVCLALEREADNFLARAAFAIVDGTALDDIWKVMRCE